MGLSLDISVSESGKGQKAWNLESDLNGKATEAEMQTFLRTALIQIAPQALREEQARGFDKKPRVRVDNQWDRPIEGVKPFGKIEYFARQNAIEAIGQIYNEISKRSLVDTGQYRDSNYVIVNRKVVATNLAELKAWMFTTAKTGLPSNTIVRFVNVTPYAARLEFAGYSKGVRGGSKGKRIGSRKTRAAKKAPGGRAAKPNGTYVLAHRIARSKYKSIANFIKFTFIPNGFDGINISGNGVFRTSYKEVDRKGNRTKRAGQPYVYPSIVLDFSEKGVSEGVVYT